MKTEILKTYLSDGSKVYSVCLTDESGKNKIYLPAVNRTYAQFFISELNILKEKYLLD